MHVHPLKQADYIQKKKSSPFTHSRNELPGVLQSGKIIKLLINRLSYVCESSQSLSQLPCETLHSGKMYVSVKKS